MIRVNLVPIEFIRVLAVPFTLGAVKYGDESWRDFIKTPLEAKKFADNRYRSMNRHLHKFMRGQHYDSEGFHHLAAVAWNALMVLVALQAAGVTNYHDPISLGSALVKYRKEKVDANTP